MKRGQPPKRGPMKRRPSKASDYCTDCECPLAVHDCGWCYGCNRAAQCNHRPRARSSRLAPVNRERRGSDAAEREEAKYLNAPLPKANPKRRKREWTRAYGSPERVVFVKSLPCVVPHCAGWPIECAHTVTGGTGRKADAETIAPVCYTHHRELHADGVRTFQRIHRLDLAACAARTEAAWQQHCAERAA